MNEQELAKQRKDNLGLIVKEVGSQAAVAEILDVTAGYLNQLMLGRRNIGEKAARKIERATGKPAGWMDSPGLCITEDWAHYLPVKVTVLPSAHANTLPGPQTSRFVPLISWIQAGSWSEAVDLFQPGDGEEWLPCPTSCSAQTFALRIEGDSMTAPYGKTYPAGCLIYVDPDLRGGIANGDRVVAKLNGSNEVTFKVYVEDAGRRFLKPLNPQYPVVTDPFEIIGKVICKVEPE